MKVGRILILAVLGAALATPAAAHGAATRAEYVAQVEPLCASTNQAIAQAGQQSASKRDLKRGLRKIKRSDNPRKALRHFSRRLGSFFRTVHDDLVSLDSSIAAVPPPMADAALIAQWIASRAVDEDNFDRGARLLQKGTLKALFQFILLADQAETHLMSTDQIVAGFGFSACLLSSSGL